MIDLAVVYKTVAACDSITYTRVNADKSHASLTLGNDTCLTGQSYFELRATPGYAAYSWMDGAFATRAIYRVNKPGIYRVKVTNTCGSKTDNKY